MNYNEIRAQYRHLIPEDSKAWVGLIFQFVLSGAAIWLSISSNYWFWFIGQLLFALCAYRWFVILHSCGHSSFFKTQWLNTIFGHIASAFCGVPYFPWKYAHEQHHVWTGWRDYDPVTRTPLPETNYPEYQLKLLDFAWKYWIPFFWITYCFQSFWNIPRLRRVKMENSKKKLMWLSVAFLLSIYAGIAAAPGIPLLKLFGMSSIILFYMLDLITLSQHNYIPAMSMREIESSDKKALPLSPWKHNLYTRSLIFPNWASRWIFLHFNLHTEHHLLPKVPHYFIDQVKFDVTYQTHGFTWVREAKKIRGRDLLLSDWEKDGHTGKRF